MKIVFSLLWVTGIAIPICGGFVLPSSARNRFPIRTLSRGVTSLRVGPYEVLDIPIGTTDKKVIKRAYKRAAMKYHPDVNKEEGAAEKFIEICNAYELLTKGGKNSGQFSSKNSNSSSSGYQPPHRRSSGFASGSGKKSYDFSSTDWRDYMPKYDEDENYDTNGDSFGAIFSDLVSGVASATSKGGSAGILNDLISFLEGNVDGFASREGYDADPDLMDVLNNGDEKEVRAEMEDADLLVQQLEAKCTDIKKDVARIKNELEINASYLDGISGNKRSATEALRIDENLNEQLVGLEAREKVVNGYLKKARRRLDRLQERLREMRSRSSYSGTDEPNSSYSTSRDAKTSSSQSYGKAPSTSGSYSSDNMGSTRSTTRESFGSSGRGSRSRRSRSRSRRSSYNESPPTSSPSTNDRAYTSSASTRAPSTSYSSSSTTRSNSQSTLTSASTVPPHRRSPSSTTNSFKEKKRLR